MKLIFAIVRYENEDDVITELTKEHYSVTKLNTTGGFLKKNNTTLMIGTGDDEVDRVINIIKEECGADQNINVNMPYVSGSSSSINYAAMPTTVNVGGATIFVVDVARYEKF